MKLINIYRIYCMTEYEIIQCKIKYQKIRKILYVCFAPYLLLKAFFSFLYDKTFGKKINMRKCAKENRHFENNLSIAAIIKNEAPYIEEWIEYYLLVGVEKFYLFDNESNDDLLEKLQRYIDKGVVEYIYYPGRARQLSAYNKAIKLCKNKTKYLLCVDLDEFVVSTINKNNIYKIIDSIIKPENGTVGLAMNWAIFGSSGHINKPKGLVLENYLYRAEVGDEVNNCIKTVFNPRFVKGYCLNPHIPVAKSGCYIKTTNDKIITSAENHDMENRHKYLRVNHYFCKSLEEGEKKRKRGIATSGVFEEYKKTEYQKNDVNDVYDDGMIKYVQLLKKKI